MDPYGDVRCKKFQGIQSKGHLVLKLLTYFQPRGYLYTVNYGVHCYGFGGRGAKLVVCMEGPAAEGTGLARVY